MTATPPYHIVPYSEILRSSSSPDIQDMHAALAEAVQSFVPCVESASVTKFITQNVRGVESNHHGRTYLFVRNDSYEVMGFFELCLTTMDFNADDVVLTKTQIAKMTGSYARSAERDGRTGGYCIGELSRAEGVSPTELPGRVILDEALRVIRSAHQIIGGRCVLIDAREDIFKSLYEPAGFKRIRTMTNDTEGSEIVVAVTNIAAYQPIASD